jgi:hypothetical protein
MPLDELCQYSALTRLLPSNYSISSLNQYTAVSGQGPGYDANFKLTSYNGQSFVFDAQNRLVGGGMQATYDGLGRCVRRTTSSGTRVYTYDDWKPILEWDQWGNWVASNAYGAGPDEILMRWDSSAGYTSINRTSSATWWRCWIRAAIS